MAYGPGLDKRFMRCMYHIPPQDAVRTQLILRLLEPIIERAAVNGHWHGVGAWVGIVAPLGREKGSQKASGKVKRWEEVKPCRT